MPCSALRGLFIFGILSFGGWLPGDAAACGAETDCLVGDRTYRVRMPAGHDGATPVGAVLYAHGFRGSAAAVMEDEALGEAVSDLGLALIAPASRRQDWTMPGSPMVGDDEIGYFEELLDDVSGRFPIDPDRIMAAGFSSGGMMVWTLACDLGDRFAGFAPVSGTFWEPIPASCPSGPASLFHVHGTSDRMVPLEGRALDKQDHQHNDRSATQGDVFEAIEMYAAFGGFGEPESYQDGEFDCARRTNPVAQVLELCLHPGGHSFDPSWVVRAWHELEALGARTKK